MSKIITAALLNFSIIFNELSLNTFEGGEVCVSSSSASDISYLSFYTFSSIGWEPNITVE